MLLRYLHISDLHLSGQAQDEEGWAAEQFNQDVVTRSLLDAVATLPPPDLVFLSGDLARRGKPDEYRVVEVFVQRLRTATGLPAERLFLVPGNHDVDRSKIRKSHIPRLYAFQSENQVTEVIGDPDMFPLLMRKFTAFREFAGRALGREVYTERDYFFAEQVAVPLGGGEVVVNVLGLNSALFAGYDGDDAQKLAFGLPQVDAALQRLDADALLTVALFHHPFACFHPADRVCKNLLLQKADLILSGHLHEPDNAFLRGAAGQALLVSAGASFESRDKENSFNVVEIDLETGRGQVQFYKYLPDHHRWKENTDANPGHPQGIFEFTVAGIAVSTATRAEARAREGVKAEAAPILGCHVISYSPLDGADQAERLYEALRAAGLPAWLDRRDVVQPGAPWDEQVDAALQGAASLLLVVTADSARENCDCAREWRHALRYKKPIVPLRFQAGAHPPLYLANRHAVDFVGAEVEKAFDLAVDHLRRRLAWLDTPQGSLQQLRDRLADAQRDLRPADEAGRARILKEIGELQRQVAAQMQVAQNPREAAKRTERSIAAGLERERQPDKPVAARTGTKFINPPPMTAPAYFQDRTVELGLLAGFLRDEACRLVTVVGRAGVGKTAMVCLLLKALESGRLPDLGSAELNGARLPLDGIVYLSAVGARRVNLPNLWADLGKLLPPAAAAELEAIYKDPQAGTAAKMAALLAHFPRGRVAVLLDNFEELLDPASGALADTELDEALRALLAAPHHGIKVLITTRLAPRALQLVEPGRQTRLELGRGLESPHAENVLRAMDADGTVGLRDAPGDLLDQARRRTRGYPRALEALYAILSADRHTSLAELLAQAEDYLPENVVEALVGQAFSRLDEAAQQVMQALAVYDRPVTPAAVDYLLQPYRPGADSAPLLNRLVATHFARKEGARYHLHPVDRTYAFARIPEGEEADRAVGASLVGAQGGDEPRPYRPWTRYALLHRAAEYYRQARLPRAEWKTLDDLAPQLAEFALRCTGGEYDTAASVLLEIDFDYLLMWGHYRLMAGLHERLQGKLTDALLKQNSAGLLGIAYASMGQVQKAIPLEKQALSAARERKDRKNEGVFLGNLGNRYAALGQTARAIEFYEQALAIDREIGDRRGEGADLTGLGNCYAGLGQTARAIEFYEQALAIDREIGDRQGEGIDLGNLGNRYADLGQTARAIEFYEQALAIAREIGDRRGEGIGLGNLAETLIDEGRYAEALQCSSDCLKIGEEIGSPVLGNAGNRRPALVYLYAGDLPAARAAAEAARQYDVPQFNPYALALLGLVAHRQGDPAAAREAFRAAVAQAETLLAHTPQLYDALDSKGLALCGLALLEQDLTGSMSGLAADAYRAARAVNADAGVVRGVLRLFDALCESDAEGRLAGVRAVAAGEDVKRP